MLLQVKAKPLYTNELPNSHRFPNRGKTPIA